MEKTKILKKRQLKVPHTFVILFFLVLFASILTWIVPPGQFEYEEVEVNGTIRNLVIPGSFEYIDPSQAKQTGIIDFASSFHRGCIAAAEIVMLIFLVNGAFSLVIKTGTFHALLGGMMRKFRGKEKLLITSFFLLFAIGSSLFGMLNEYNGLIPIMVGLGVAIGYDPIVGLSIVGLGAYTGFAASIMNPYTVVVAQSIAGVPIYSNSWFRAICFVFFCTVTLLYIFRYMNRIRKDPSKSLMKPEESEFAFKEEEISGIRMTGRHKIILLSILVALATIIYGSITQGWGSIQLTGVFILMGIFAALVDRWKPDRIANEFIEGCKAVAFGALITGIAQAILVILQDGKIVDTIINFFANSLVGLPPLLASWGMLVVQTLINFAIPSGSGQAATVMPIMAPLGDILGVSREVACLAFQFGDGFSNLLWPTGGVAVVCGLGGIPVHKWWKFYIPLFGILFVCEIIVISLAVLLGL